MDPDTDVVEVDDTGDVTEAPPEEQVVEVGVDPYSEERLLPAAGNTPPAAMVAQGETNATVELRLAQLVKDAKTRGTFEEDRKWYEIEGQRVREAARRNNVKEEDMIEVAALLSPKMLWDDVDGSGQRRFLNIAAAERAVHMHRMYPDMEPEEIVKLPGIKEGLSGFGGNYVKSIRHLRGEKQHHGPKTFNFWHNLEDPEGTRDMVTIDSLMAAAIVGRPLSGKSKEDSQLLGQITRTKTGEKSPGGYGWAQRRIHAVAQQVGITPQELQAVIWSEWRRQHPKNKKRAL